jgi:hypothetical protein
MTELEVLIAARALIAPPERWCRTAYACDGNGNTVWPNDERASQFCGYGAILRAAHTEDWTSETESAARFLDRAVEDCFVIWQVGPERKHAEVLAAFDTAIAKAQR